MAAQPERPLPTVRFDAYVAFVPSIEAGARALRREAERARRAFRPTDMDAHQRDALALEELAHRLDVRRLL